MAQEAILTEPFLSAETLEKVKRMTFQVVLIGTDGLILGSDRRSVYISNESNDDLGASAQPQDICKFELSSDGEIVCAFAGSPYSSSVAKAIAHSTEYSLAASDAEREKEAKAKLRGLGGLPNGQKDEIIIARRGELGHIDVLARRGSSEATFTKVTSHICLGNNLISARFILRHFYKSRPIDDLVDIALLTLSCAAWEDPSNIGGGFDIILLNKKGFTKPKHYAMDDPKILENRERFNRAVLGSIYPISS